jgi:hypothetical protein
MEARQSIPTFHMGGGVLEIKTHDCVGSLQPFIKGGYNFKLGSDIHF